jgi:glycosyltransferase involved in cell wall biosynthesis
MRILMLTQFFAPIVGGEERAVQDLSTELAARGHEVTVATLRLDGTAASEEIQGVRIVRLDSFFGRFGPAFKEPQRRHLPPAPDPEVRAGLRRILAEVRPDIVHAHNWIVHSVPPARRRNDAPLVLSLHDYSLVCATKRFMHFGSPCTGPGPAKCLRCAASHYGVAKGSVVAGSLLAMTPALRRRVDVCLPVSAGVARALELDKLRMPFEVLPNLIPKRADDDPQHVDTDLATLLPDDGFILFLGDATEDKGAGTLLEAHASLDNAPPLVFVGRPFGLEGRDRPSDVHVLDAWPHASALEAVRRCSMLVTPSLVPETFGMAALEAMACGRPVVASSVGGLPELVVDGETGLLVPPGDATALRDAIAELVDDPARREVMGRAGKARAELYSAGTILPRLEGVYGALLEGRPVPRATTRRADVHD